MTDGERAPGTDLRGMAVAFAGSLALYAVTLTPVVHWGDSAELSTRALALDLSPVARGYPLLQTVTWALARVAGDAALAANLASALFGATAVALTYAVGAALGGTRLAGTCSAAVLGLAHTFWWFAGIAEVYTLHATFLALAILLTLSAARAGSARRFTLGAVLGLSLLHHRMIAFAFPAFAAAFALGVVRNLPPGRRARAAADVVAGVLVGAIPFAILCVTSSRSPPEGTPDPFAWWVRDVFLGGDQNARFFLDAGSKSLAESGAYLAKWIAFNLPGPALLLAAVGAAELLRRKGPEALLFAVLLPLHLVFPLRYDWTGDQFSFLVPFYVCAAPLAGLGAAVIEARRGAVAGRVWTAAAAVAPLALYAAVAATPLGEMAFPHLDPERRPLPFRATRREPHEWTGRTLDRLPQRAVLHCDWGVGQVVRYLQAAEGRRNDVDARIWFRRLDGAPAAADPSATNWDAVEPGIRLLPPALEAVRVRLEDHGDGLYRIATAGGPR